MGARWPSREVTSLTSSLLAEEELELPSVLTDEEPELPSALTGKTGLASADVPFTSHK